jgi:3-phosphoshikimate 1-carboxyvinyltransferase
MSSSGSPYPELLPIQPLDRPARAVVRVPGSKSITNRAMVLAALCSGERELSLFDCLRSEDTEVMIAALRQLGFQVETKWDSPNPVVALRRPSLRLIPAEQADLFVANSGTTMRFLTAMVSLGQRRYRLDGVARMRERPIADLLDALRDLGIDARSEADNGCPPVVIQGGSWKGGHVRIKGNVSSQFLSGLLLAAPFAPVDTTIETDGPLVSEPYVEMTTRMMGQWNLEVRADGRGRFHVPGRQVPTPPSEYQIEPDASAASYFFAAAALTGGRVQVPHLSRNSLQGDVRFVDVLERMGCRTEWSSGFITVEGGPLHGIDVDMNDISDTVMTLGAVACFADGPTTIRNVAHIRHKETDRLSALATELRRVGAEVEEFDDGLTITPRPLHGAEIETYNDHRMAMSMALVGLHVPGIVIKNPGCVAKTYPGFFADLERLRN